MTYLTALVLTLGIEVPLVPLVVDAAWEGDDDPPAGFAISTAVAANLLTHGTLWTVLPLLMTVLDYWTAVTLCEIAVMFAEAGIYAYMGLLKPWPALGLSIALNGGTWGLGVVMALGG